MTMRDPSITVFCDKDRCGFNQAFTLVPLLLAGWGPDTVKEQAKAKGWAWISETEHYCLEHMPFCTRCDYYPCICDATQRKESINWLELKERTRG